MRRGSIRSPEAKTDYAGDQFHFSEPGIHAGGIAGSHRDYNVLAALAPAALTSAKADSKRIACISNLRQIGIAVRNYSTDYGGLIPYGPVARPILIR